MKQSQYFLKTTKNKPADDVSINARLLEQGGFVYKNSAGIYTYLPLGWRVMQKVANIIREEMNAIGGQEMFMPGLHDKHYLKATNRWDVDVVFKVSEGQGKEPQFNISWTHEEIVAEISTKFVHSYKDLPLAVYQIQTKFRNEPRAKSGLLRGREFMMKDLYSLHVSEEDLWNYYEKVAKAYHKIFERCGLKAYYTVAAGGDFTVSNTHEFQVLSPVGEDTILVCEKCGFAENAEISKLESGSACPECGGKVNQEKSIEVGNIFPLGIKYSEAFGLKFTNEKGQSHPVVMGSYGIGLGRVMATIVEVYNDGKGIIWPNSVAPFNVHLISIKGAEKQADDIYQKLEKEGVQVLYDDRDVSPGVKFADSDLIGIPRRVVVSPKTLEKDSVEVKRRSADEQKLVKIKDITKKVKN